MTQRQQFPSRAEVSRPRMLDGGSARWSGIDSRAIRGDVPFIAAGPITAALSGGAITAATEFRHGIAAKLHAIGEQLGAGAPPIRGQP